MTTRCHHVFAALLAVLAAEPVAGQADDLHPLLAAKLALLPSCQAALARGPDAPPPEAVEDGWRCWTMASFFVSVLSQNCEALQRGGAPSASSVFLGGAAQPPSVDAAIEAFVIWAGARPERELAGTEGVYEALVEAFPCPA